jgi:hypothetical protein
MTAFRRVFGERAGPDALGILVPPGRRTVVVVRPRTLPWDLLLIGPGEDMIRFRDFALEEAEVAAEAFGRALDEWTTGGHGEFQVVPAPGAPGHCVQVVVGACRLVACPRAAGQAYRPMVFATLDEATRAARAVTGVLCPAPGARQEVYFNTRHFARS